MYTPDRNSLSPLLETVEDFARIPQNIFEVTKEVGGSAVGAVVAVGTNAARSGIELGQNALNIPLDIAKSLGSFTLNLLPALGDRETKE